MVPSWLANFVNVDEIGLYVVVFFFGGLIEMAGRLGYDERMLKISSFRGSVNSDTRISGSPSHGSPDTRIPGYPDTLTLMKAFQNYTLTEYSRVLSLKVPAPGGGSAAALIAAVGAALLSMVANYSIGKGASKQAEKRVRDILRQTERLRKRLLELVDLDAQAYLNVVRSRQASPQKRKAALKAARQVPQEVCRLCYKAVQLSSDLVRYGNKYLLSDVEVALEALQAAFNSAKINVEINQ